MPRRICLKCPQLGKAVTRFKSKPPMLKALPSPGRNLLFFVVTPHFGADFWIKLGAQVLVRDCSAGSWKVLMCSTEHGETSGNQTFLHEDTMWFHFKDLKDFKG